MGDRNQTAADKIAWAEWLTIPEAAEYLSRCGSEVFNESRIYKEAIDYRLRLSLYFHEGHPGNTFQIGRTEHVTNAKPDVLSVSPLPYNFNEIVAVYDGCVQPHCPYRGLTTQLYGVYDLTLLGCGKSLITEARLGLEYTPSSDPHGIILERDDFFYQVLEERPAHSMEYLPASTFPKGCYFVVREQSLREFEKKFLAKKPETQAPEPSIPQSATESPLPPAEGRPKGSLHEAVEKLYLKLLEGKIYHPLEKGNPSVFIEEMRKYVLENRSSGGKSDSDISAFIQERISDIKGAMGNRRIITQERVLNSSKSKEIIQKSVPFTTEDISKILYSLRKKYPLPN